MFNNVPGTSTSEWEADECGKENQVFRRLWLRCDVVQANNITFSQTSITKCKISKCTVLGKYWLFCCFIGYSHTYTCVLFGEIRFNRPANCFEVAV